MHNRYAAKAKKEMDGKTKKERGEGREETQRSVSTHTVTVICRNGEVCPSANVLPSNGRKLHSSSKGAGHCWVESQPVYTHTVVLGRKQPKAVTSESTVENHDATIETALGQLLLILLESLQSGPRGKEQ